MSRFLSSSSLVLFLVLSACSSSSSPSPTGLPLPSQTTASQLDMSAGYPIPSAIASPEVIPFIPQVTHTLPVWTPTQTPTEAPIPAYLEIAAVTFSPWELVMALAWSPDGSSLAAAAGESIHLYETSPLQERLKLTVGVWSTSLAFSPDGTLLASGNRDGRARLWDASSGTLKLSLPAHKKGVNSLAFSPDGITLATGGNDAVARLWDVLLGKNLGQLIGGTFAVPSIVFRRDGSSLAIVNGAVIRLRDVKTTRFVKTFRGDKPFYSLAISPDGLTLASGTSAGTVVLWDILSGSQRLTLTDPALNTDSLPFLVWSVAFSPDGRTLAAAGSDGKIRLWDTTNGELRVNWVAHTRAVTSVVFSPNGRILATGGLDGVLRLWQVR
jgi:WD40 repeat protein